MAVVTKGNDGKEPMADDDDRSEDSEQQRRARADGRRAAKGEMENLVSNADRQQVQDFVRSVMEATVGHNQAAAKDFLARNLEQPAIGPT